MANTKERREKNVKFGSLKDDNFEVENEVPHEEGGGFHSTRDYWQTICNSSPREQKQDFEYKC